MKPSGGMPQLLYLALFLLLVLAGCAGIFTYVYYPAWVDGVFRSLRGIAGKNYTLEIHEYYFRKYLLLSSTAVFSGGLGILLWRFVPCDRWKYPECRWAYLTAAVLLLGAFFRVYSWSTHFFWNDTLLLADSVRTHGFSQLWGYIGNDQSAPWGFLLLSKVMGECFGYSPHVLGFFPLVFSLCSLWLFYVLCRQIFVSHSIRFLAVCLFSVNMSLCFYSGEFKQYSGDVFGVLLVLCQVVPALRQICSKTGIPAGESFCRYFSSHWPLLASVLVVLQVSQSVIFVITAAGVVLFSEWLVQKKGICLGCRTLFPMLACWCCGVLCVLLMTVNNLTAALVNAHAEHFAPNPFALSSLDWYVSRLEFCFRWPYGFAHAFPVIWVIPLSLCVLGAIHLLRKECGVGCVMAFSLLFLFSASMAKQYPLASGRNIIDSRLCLFTVPLVLVMYAAAMDFFREHIPRVFKALFVVCLLSGISVFLFAIPQYVKIQPLLDRIEQYYSQQVAIYTNVSGKYAIELMGKFPADKVYCVSLADKSLFLEPQYFGKTGKYQLFCVHHEPEDTCAEYLPPNVTVLRRHRYPRSFLYELEVREP